MTKQELYDEINKLIFAESGEISRDEYRELLEEIISDCQLSLDALDEDDV